MLKVQLKKKVHLIYKLIYKGLVFFWLSFYYFHLNF